VLALAVSYSTRWSKTTLACLLLTVACSEPSDSTGDEGLSECVGGQFCPSGQECISGYCVPLQDEETGDGDLTTGDGDGDSATGDGDGDGDPTTGDGDGDGDPTTGDGDGDGDPTTGDGDGDPTTGDGDGDGASCGNGIIDPGEQCDGNNLNGFNCQSFGYSGGTLACDPQTCTYNTQNCFL
jgi:hypothetical protein